MDILGYQRKYQCCWHSDLFDYFQKIGALEEPRSAGLVNLVLYFGFIQCCLFGLLVYLSKTYANDLWLFKLVVFVVFFIDDEK